MSEQVVVDSLEFARNRDTLKGEIAVAELLRLTDVLYTDQGVLEYTVSGGTNQHGKPVLHCRVTGSLQLQCQRCLKGVEYMLDTQSELLLARDEEELAHLDESDEEGTDAILADSRLNVLALVEDEVLLDLPMVPRHPIGTCEAKPSGESISTRNPFAVLAKLKPGQETK